MELSRIRCQPKHERMRAKRARVFKQHILQIHAALSSIDCVLDTQLSDTSAAPVLYFTNISHVLQVWCCCK